MNKDKIAELETWLESIDIAAAAAMSSLLIIRNRVINIQEILKGKNKDF